MPAAYRVKPMEDRRILVLGGLGFVGSNLAHRLVSLGARVTLLDACLDFGGWNPANLSGIESRVRFVKGDVRDRRLVERLVRDQEVLFNLFAQTSHLRSMEEPFLDLDINVRGHLSVLEACRTVNDDAVLVYGGSRAQTGEARYLPVDERHPESPADLYGVHKLAAEKYYLLYHRVHGLPTVSLRIGNTYGPRHQMRHGESGVLNWFVRKALRNETIELHGGGRQSRDFLYVDDLVDALLLAAQTPRARGETFVVGSDTMVTLHALARKIVKIAGRGHYRAIPYPPGRKAIEVRRYAVTTAKLRRFTGWVPRTSLDEGLRRTVEFYRENLPAYL